jgi:DNA-binding transcriptional regulator YhcF (GntR family)
MFLLALYYRQYKKRIIVRLKTSDSIRKMSLLYKQIEYRIKEAIFNGKLKSGDQLFSIRKMADLCGVSVITITHAYKKLSDKRIIICHPGKGNIIKALFQIQQKKGMN